MHDLLQTLHVMRIVLKISRIEPATIPLKANALLTELIRIQDAKYKTHNVLQVTMSINKIVGSIDPT